MPAERGAPATGTTVTAPEKARLPVMASEPAGLATKMEPALNVTLPATPPWPPKPAPEDTVTRVAAREPPARTRRPVVTVVLPV